MSRATLIINYKNYWLFLNILLVNGEKFQKSQTLSKHGIKNGVAMATTHTFDAKFFHNLVLW